LLLKQFRSDSIITTPRQCPIGFAFFTIPVKKEERVLAGITDNDARRYQNLLIGIRYMALFIILSNNAPNFIRNLKSFQTTR